MKSSKRRCSIPLLMCLTVTFLGCQTQDVKNAHSAKVVKSKWATLSARLSHDQNISSFPSKIVFRTMDGYLLRDVVRKKKIECARSGCNLHPGKHTIGIDYIWSKTESIEEQKKKKSLEALGTSLIIFGAVPDVAVYENSKCQATIEFEAQAEREYAANVAHMDKRKAPDVLRIVDTESDSVIASQKSCDPIYETALPFSDEPVSSDRCAIHLISEIPAPMTFYLNDSHPYYGFHMSHTVLIDPGEQEIKVTPGRVSPSSKPKSTGSVVVRCDGGEAKYIQVKRTEGFWTRKYALTELSAEEGHSAIKIVLR